MKPIELLAKIQLAIAMHGDKLSSTISAEQEDKGLEFYAEVVDAEIKYSPTGKPYLSIKVEQ